MGDHKIPRHVQRKETDSCNSASTASFNAGGLCWPLGPGIQEKLVRHPRACFFLSSTSFFAALLLGLAALPDVLRPCLEAEEHLLEI